MNMGVDLTLLPIDYEHNDGGSAFSRLMLERRRELWPDIEKQLPVHPIAKITGYMGDNFEARAHDPYGTPLTWAYAKDFSSFKDHEAVQDNDTNRAIWAYLAALNPETKIVLYWH